MELTLATWIAIPAVGGVIGYLTNRLAVKMIFRPLKPKNLLLFKLQGLMPRRQKDLAKSIGGVVGDHLVRSEDIAKGLEGLDFETVLTDLLNVGLAPKIQELRALPLIGGFLTEDRIDEIRKSIVNSLIEHRSTLLEKLEGALEQGLDVRAVVEQKVAGFPMEKLESLVLQIASRELRSIEILGGVLGIIIGLGQVGLLYFVG